MPIELNRFDRLIGWAVTKQDYMTLALVHDGEFLDCHIYNAFLIHDVVGNARCQAAMEDHRLVGVRFRYFNSHHDRLAEFQQRLDVAKARRRK